jgi:Fe-S-cluster containining protein
MAGKGPGASARRSGASVSSSTYDCTSCGACCFGGHDRYVALFPQDMARAIPEGATRVIDGRHYMAMACGHCAQLTITPEGATLCAIYDDRPEACRAFRAGSFECLQARRHRGPEAEALRAHAMAKREPAPPGQGAAPVDLPGAMILPPEGEVSPSP